MATVFAALAKNVRGTPPTGWTEAVDGQMAFVLKAATMNRAGTISAPARKNGAGLGMGIISDTATALEALSGTFK